MYSYLSTANLMLLADCLIQSHRFAKTFNSSHDQRNILWKAGFKGTAKPNLLRQETQSLACVLRIHFKMYTDDGRSQDWPDVEKRLIYVCKEALEYFLSLRSEPHRDAWTSLLLLIMTRLLKMTDQQVSFVFTAVLVQIIWNFPFLQFSTHVSNYYSLFCDMICLDIKPELRSVLRRIFLRVGDGFGVVVTSNLQ